MKQDQQIIRAVPFFLLLLAACTNAGNETGKNGSAGDDTTLQEEKKLVFDRLTGTWQSEDGKTFERWTKNENGNFHSVVFSVKGTDTLWKEDAQIYPENGKWVFENTVKGQNDDKPVRFTSVQVTKNSVQFSNPAHDFPTDIHYTLPDANTVNAFITGPNDKGGKDTIPFNYTRVIKND